MLLVSSTTTTSTFSTGHLATKSLSVLSAMSMFGLQNLGLSALFWRPARIPTSAVSSGLVMEHMSVSVLAREKSKFGMSRREPSSAACTVMKLVLVSWDGTNTLCQLVLVPVSFTITMSALRNIKSLSSFLTPLRFAALSGALTVLNLRLVVTTTSSLSGTLVPWPFPSLPRPTTKLPSRPSAGAHGLLMFSLLEVDHTTVTSTSGTLQLVLVSTASILVPKSPPFDGAHTTRRLSAPAASPTTPSASGAIQP